MATYDATDLNLRIAHAGGATGNAVVHTAKMTPAAAANGDIYRVMRIPAGTRIDAVYFGNDDLDSNGSPTVVCKVGYTPVRAADGPAASDAYWAAAGQTYLQSAGTRWLPAGKPVTFDFDVYLIVTLGANSATFASGDIWVTAIGELVGTK